MESLNLEICPKVCKECPFLNTSIRGYLGPYQADEIMDIQQYEGLFGCHLQLGQNEKENQSKILSGEIKICRGYILSATLSCKQFGQNPIYGKALRELQNKVNSEEGKEKILTKFNFRQYHE